MSLIGSTPMYDQRMWFGIPWIVIGFTTFFCIQRLLRIQPQLIAPKPNVHPVLTLFWDCKPHGWLWWLHWLMPSHLLYRLLSWTFRSSSMFRGGGTPIRLTLVAVVGPRQGWWQQKKSFCSLHCLPRSTTFHIMWLSPTRVSCHLPCLGIPAWHSIVGIGRWIHSPLNLKIHTLASAVTHI